MGSKGDEERIGGKEMKFSEWMETFKDKFSTYSNEEVRDIAIASGFDDQEVRSYLFKNNGERRAA